MGKLNYITKAQTVAISLVVFGHCMPLCMRAWTPQPIMWAYHIVYSFHMPFFIFLSGYLFLYTNAERDIDYVKFMIGKLKKLIIPYVVISSLAFFPKNIFSSFAIRDISFTYKSYIDGLIYPQKNPIIYFWFLPTLFIIFFIAPTFKRIILRGGIAAIIFYGLLLMILNTSNPVRVDILNIKGVAMYLIYFYLGCVAVYYREKMFIIKNYAFLAVSFILLIGLNYAMMIKMFNKEAAGLLHLITAVVGISFLLSFVYFLDSKRINYFTYCDGYYYQIFLLSWFFQVLFRVLFQMHFLNYFITFITMFFGGLFLPVVATKYITNRARGVGFVIGLS